MRFLPLQYSLLPSRVMLTERMAQIPQSRQSQTMSQVLSRYHSC